MSCRTPGSVASRPRQPSRLVLFGEKSSLGPVLRPLAREHEADLYLMSGEISDTLLYQMARDGTEDGTARRRPLFRGLRPVRLADAI